MALIKAAQAAQAPASNAAGTTTTGPALAINYGVSGVAVVANGATGPDAGCDFVVEMSNDGGATWFEWSRQAAGTTASTAWRFPFGFGPGGNGGDWDHYRVAFGGNTGQDVTVQADAMTTTSY